MGAYLSKPIIAKNPEFGKNDVCSWGLCSMQGWRKDMEDAHICEPLDLPGGDKGMLFGVFDGHGGAKVALLAKELFPFFLTNLASFKSKDYP